MEIDTSAVAMGVEAVMEEATEGVMEEVTEGVMVEAMAADLGGAMAVVTEEDTAEVMDTVDKKFFF